MFKFQGVLFKTLTTKVKNQKKKIPVVWTLENCWWDSKVLTNWKMAKMYYHFQINYNITIHFQYLKKILNRKFLSIFLPHCNKRYPG